MSSNSGPASWTRPGFSSSNPSANRRPGPEPGLHHSEAGSSSGIESNSPETPNCETICHMLKMLSCSDGHRALLAITSSVESCQSLRRAGCIPLLIQIMHPNSTTNLESHPSTETKSRAARALKNIVHFNPDEKMKRKEIRVLRLLETIRTFATVAATVASSSSSSSTTSTPPPHAHPTSSCTALMKLSFDEEHRNIMCTLGAIHALADLIISDHKLHGAHMELSDSTDSSSTCNPAENSVEASNGTGTGSVSSANNFTDCITIRRYSCMTLTNLTFGDGVNKALLCSMTEFLQCLVAQLGFQRNEDVVQVTASVIRNLSWHGSSNARLALQSSQAVSGLMTAALRATKESTLKATLSALWNLSAHSAANKAAICSTPNALQFLVTLLRPDHHHPFYQQFHQQNQNPGQSQSQGQGPISRPYDKSMTIIENAGGILRNVSSHIAGVPQYRKILREAHCFEVILSQLRSSSLTVVSNACGTLWNLSGHEEEQKRLLELNAMPMLKSLRFSKDERISQAATATLRNLLAYFDQQQQQQQQIQLQQQQHQKAHRSLDLEIEQNTHQNNSNLETSQDTVDSVESGDVEENETELRVEQNDNIDVEDDDDEQPLDLTITSCKSSPIRKLNPPPFLNPPITYNGSVSATRSCPDIQVKQSQNQHQSQLIHNHHPHHHLCNSHSPARQAQPQVEIDPHQNLQSTPKLEGSSDETFNYSLNYDEEEDDHDQDNEVEDLMEDEELREKHDPEQKDSVRTFATEGTPRFSNGGSMVDLTAGGIGMGMGGQHVDVCIQFQVEDTPAVFSRTSSLSSIDNGESGPGSRTPLDKIDKISSKKTSLINNSIGVVTSASTSASAASPPVHSSMSIEPIPSSTKPAHISGSTSSQCQIPNQSQSQKRVMFSADATPLMFSRCSSVGSLESCGDLNNGRESDCVSEFSRRTSEVVSPSDLPDSPRECKPTNNQTFFKIPETVGEADADAETQVETRDKKKIPTAAVTVCDELKVFEMEGTPFLISNATSLSDIVGEFLESNNNPSQEKEEAIRNSSQLLQQEKQEKESTERNDKEKVEMLNNPREEEEEEEEENKTEITETSKKQVPESSKEDTCVNPIIIMTEKSSNNHNNIDITNEDEDDPIYSDAQLLQKCIRAGRQNFAPILNKKKTDIMTATYTVAVLEPDVKPQPPPQKKEVTIPKRLDEKKGRQIEDIDDENDEVDLSNLIQRGRAKLISMTNANANIKNNATTTNNNNTFTSTSNSTNNIPTKIPVPISMTTTRSDDNLKRHLAITGIGVGNTRKLNNNNNNNGKNSTQSDNLDEITEKLQSANLESPRNYSQYGNENENNDNEIETEADIDLELDIDIDVDNSSQDVTTAILRQPELFFENDFDQNCPSDITTTPTPIYTESASISISASVSDTWTDDTPSFSSMSIPSMSISKAMSRVVKAEKIDTLSDIEQPTLLESRSNSLMSSHRNPGTTTTNNHNHSHSQANTHSHQNKHYPLTPAQKQLLQSSITCSSSQMSNLMNQKPPAEFFDLELESSMISVASIKSEIFDDASLLISSSSTTNQALQMSNNNHSNNIMSISNIPNNNNNSYNNDNNNDDGVTIPIPTSASSQIQASNNIDSKSDDSKSNPNSPSKYDTYVIKRIESSSSNSNSNTNSPKDRRRNERYMTRTIEKFDLSKASETVISTRTIEKDKDKERIKASSSSSAVVNNSGFVNVRPTRASELRANANANASNNNNNINGSNNSSRSRENSPIITSTKRSKTPTKIVSLPINIIDDGDGDVSTSTPINNKIVESSNNSTGNSSNIMTTTLPRNTKLMEETNHKASTSSSTSTSAPLMKRIHNMTVSSSTGGLSTVLHPSSSSSIPTSMSTDFGVSYSVPINSISSPSIAQGHQPQIIGGGNIKEEQINKHHHNTGSKLMNFGGRLGNLFRKSFINSPNKLNLSGSSSSTTSSMTTGNSNSSSSSSGSSKRIWGRKKEKKQKEKAFVTPFNYKPPDEISSSAVPYIYRNIDTHNTSSQSPPTEGENNKSQSSSQSQNQIYKTSSSKITSV